MPRDPIVQEKAQLQAHYEQTEGIVPSASADYSVEHQDDDGLIPVTQESGQNANDPPPYSGPSSSSQVTLSPRESQARGPQRYPGLPVLDYVLYSPPLFDMSSDCTSIKSTVPYLSSTVSALVALVRAQATVPPKPQIHITGNRGRKTDFAVKLNLMSLLLPDDARKRLDYVRCVGAGEMALRGSTKPSLEPHVADGGIEEWCRRFVADDAAVKVFVLERVVANLDVGWLEGQIRSLVAGTGYKGVVNVSFPVTHARVVVQNPDRVNRFFTNVSTFFTGKNSYEVVKAVWPFATHRAGETGRQCIVQSEERWWKEWREPILYAISTKRQGWVTNEDKLEAIMEGKGKGVSVVDWGPEDY